MATTKIWFSNGTNYTWPEQQAGVGNTVGVCFPGGGTRAMCAAMGQLRALVAQGLIGKIDTMSCVSGGSWAATAFAYYNAGASSDEDFLGSVIAPADITKDGLEALDSGCLAYGATQSLDDAIDRAHGAGVPADMLWITGVGEVFFQRYGLWDPQNPPYFTLDLTTQKEIQSGNPSLANAPFITVRANAGYTIPYLLINATIDGPTSPGAYDPDPLMMVTYSPLYAGIPYQQQLTYAPRNGGQPIVATVGGGFIEPFAWGSDAPTQPPSNGTVDVDLDATPFTVADASGTSSSAFASALQSRKTFDVLLPEENYWPPMASGTQQAAQLFDWGDGGNLENYGLLPLLMRGVQRIILFVNTEVPLTGGAAGQVDPNLPLLFGQTPGSQNVVFSSDDYDDLIASLLAIKNSGAPMIYKKTHTILQNDTWGIPGGGTVDILWVYLDEVKDWYDQLTDKWVRDEIWLGDAGAFPHFPNYKTVDEDGLLTLTRLTAPQANLLADLTCWVVTSNAQTFSNFISNG